MRAQHGASTGAARDAAPRAGSFGTSAGEERLPVVVEWACVAQVDERDREWSQQARHAVAHSDAQTFHRKPPSATEQHAMPASSSSTVGAGASGNDDVATHAQASANTNEEAGLQTSSVSQVSPLGQSASQSQSLQTPSSQPALWNSFSAFAAENGLASSLEQSGTPQSGASASTAALPDYPSKLKRDRDGNLFRWRPTVCTSADEQTYRR